MTRAVRNGRQNKVQTPRRTVFTVTCTPLQCRKGTIRDGNTNRAGRIRRPRPCQVVNWKMPKSGKTIYTYSTVYTSSQSSPLYSAYANVFNNLVEIINQYTRKTIFSRNGLIQITLYSQDVYTTYTFNIKFLKYTVCIYLII